MKSVCQTIYSAVSGFGQTYPRLSQPQSVRVITFEMDHIDDSVRETIDQELTEKRGILTP